MHHLTDRINLHLNLPWRPCYRSDYPNSYECPRVRKTFLDIISSDIRLYYIIIFMIDHKGHLSVNCNRIISEKQFDIIKRAWENNDECEENVTVALVSNHNNTRVMFGNNTGNQHKEPYYIDESYFFND